MTTNTRSTATEITIESERIQLVRLGNGTVMYLDIHGHHHRSNGPAVQYTDGTGEWWHRGCRDNKLGGMTFTHQANSEEDSERIQLRNGTVVYLDIHSHLHRSDGPAIQCRDGTKEWWIRGFRHRDEGPAVTGYIGRSDHEEWWNEGVLHRDNGPAIDSNATGRKEWYRHGKRHRDDGPAIERADGDKLWYRNGKLHRDDGPAIEQRGEKSWYRNGKLHRDNGPAIERADGEKFWFSDGEEQGHVPASPQPERDAGEYDAGEDEVDEDLDIEPPSRGLSR